MNRQRALDLLSRSKPELQARFGVTRLALLGSTARDTASSVSDVDVLVAFDGPATSKRYFGVQFYLEDLLGCPVDLSPKKPCGRSCTPTTNRSGSMSEIHASREDAKARRDIEEVAAIVIDAALQLHRDLGPGLLELVYETVLSKMLEHRGLSVERQKPVPIHYQGISLDEGFRLDLLVDGQLIVELKSVENFHPVHPKQLLTYLRLMNLPLGLLINFGAPLLKNGLQRVVNKHTNFASSCLRVHQNQEVQS